MKKPEDFERADAKADDLTVRAMRNLLMSNGILTKEGKLNRETAAKRGWKVKDVDVALQEQ